MEVRLRSRLWEDFLGPDYSIYRTHQFPEVPRVGDVINMHFTAVPFAERLTDDGIVELDVPHHAGGRYEVERVEWEVDCETVSEPEVWLAPIDATIRPMEGRQIEWATKFYTEEE